MTIPQRCRGMKCAKCAHEGAPLWKQRYTGKRVEARWMKPPQIWFCIKCREEWQ